MILLEKGDVAMAKKKVLLVDDVNLLIELEKAHSNFRWTSLSLMT